jgi:hypothetical protein
MRIDHTAGVAVNIYALSVDVATIADPTPTILVTSIFNLNPVSYGQFVSYAVLVHM